MRNPASVLITGASSGIGRALAEVYAADGCRLELTGRDLARLEPVAAACRELGGTPTCHEIDVGDGGGMQALFEKIRTPDLTIANAGISVGTSGGRNRVEIDRRILQTNLDGVVNTIYPAIGALIAKPRPEAGPRGQIAIMSSLATFNGYPGAAAYGASKAAVRSLGEALRAERYRDGIEICVICPGFIRSNITDKNNFRMPFFMEAKRAARIIQRGLARNRGRIAFPWQTYWMARLAGTLPSGLRDALVRRMKS